MQKGGLNSEEVVPPPVETKYEVYEDPKEFKRCGKS